LSPTVEGQVLVLASADGAGSAQHADVGARHASRGITRLVLDDLAEGLTVEQIDRDTVLSWYLRLRWELADRAFRCRTSLDQLACTLLLAVVGPTSAAFAQIGDGAIVTGDDGGYQAVFWPQNGEYANSTNFITDPAFADLLLFERRSGPVDELALFTDGLQSVALQFASRTVHQPFFRPMFQRLRGSRPGEGLVRGLRQFLTSPALNERTDDDKTLILATRVPARASDTHPL
jgi:hypothetical protein